MRRPSIVYWGACDHSVVIDSRCGAPDHTSAIYIWAATLPLSLQVLASHSGGLPQGAAKTNAF
eukprot:scaffold624_cov402-Prasinococcus_capsulatus_cf.AAC.84